MDQTAQNVHAILEMLGGKDNVISLINCMTRLRVVVRNEAAVKEQELKNLACVINVIYEGKNSYAIVVGPGKSSKYAGYCKEIGVGITTDVKNNIGNRTETAKAKKGNNPLKILGEIFIPLIPGSITAGICAGIASLITQAIPGYADIPVWKCIYQILSLISTAFMTYITAWVGYRGAERFGGTPILGGMLGMIASLEGINEIAQILGLYNDAAPLDSILRSGKGGILAVLAGVFLMSIIEKKIRKIMPDALDVVFTPLVTMLICIIPYVFLIMPLFGLVSSGLTAALGTVCMSDNVLVRMAVGYVAAALFLPLVATGMHHGLVALYSVQLSQLGYVTLYPALAMAGAGQVGTSFALWRKAKKAGNKSLPRIIAGGIPAGLLGIGEPLIYGVTLPLGKPFILAGLGAGFGGAFVMAMQAAAVSWGPSGLTAIPIMTAGPNSPVMTAVIYVIGLAISYVAGFLMTTLFYDEKNLVEKEDTVKTYNGDVATDHVCALNTMTIENVKGNSSLILCTPAEGKQIPMKEIPDKVFSESVLGPCLGILPVNGNIYSPCDGIITSIADTLHAVCITSGNGEEILLHIGIDTVKLKGRGFEPLVHEGDRVTKGQKIMLVDLQLLEAEGCNPMVITILCQ